MLTCRHCGWDNPETAAFCTNCGRGLGRGRASIDKITDSGLRFRAVADAKGPDEAGVTTPAHPVEPPRPGPTPPVAAAERPLPTLSAPEPAVESMPTMLDFRLPSDMLAELSRMRAARDRASGDDRTDEPSPRGPGAGTPDAGFDGARDEDVGDEDVGGEDVGGEGVEGAGVGDLLGEDAATVTARTGDGGAGVSGAEDASPEDARPERPSFATMDELSTGEALPDAGDGGPAAAPATQGGEADDAAPIPGPPTLAEFPPEAPRDEVAQAPGDEREPAPGDEVTLAPDQVEDVDGEVLDERLVGVDAPTASAPALAKLVPSRRPEAAADATTVPAEPASAQAAPQDIEGADTSCDDTPHDAYDGAPSESLDEVPEIPADRDDSVDLESDDGIGTSRLDEPDAMVDAIDAIDAIDALPDPDVLDESVDVDVPIDAGLVDEPVDVLGEADVFDGAVDALADADVLDESIDEIHELSTMDLDVEDVAASDGPEPLLDTGDFEAVEVPSDAARSGPPPLPDIAARFLLRPLSHNVSEARLIAVGDRPVGVGRVEGDVRVAEDPFASPMHARFLIEGEDLVVEDLGSLNGVWLRVRFQHLLRPGDVVLLGQQVLRLDAASARTNGTGPNDGTRRLGAHASRSPFRLTQLADDGAPLDVFHLPRDGCRIGRQIADLVFTEDNFMSGTHAALVPRDDGVELRDLASRNGSWVRVRGRQRLRHGDAVMIGRTVWRVGLPVS